MSPYSTTYPKDSRPIHSASAMPTDTNTGVPSIRDS